MKIINIEELNEFLDAVNHTQGGVYLRSPYGDCYNLKSLFSQYIAIGELLGRHGDQLELYCDFIEDEQLFFKFFKANPGVLTRK